MSKEKIKEETIKFTVGTKSSYYSTSQEQENTSKAILGELKDLFIKLNYTTKEFTGLYQDIILNGYKVRLDKSDSYITFSNDRWSTTKVQMKIKLGVGQPIEKLKTKFEEFFTNLSSAEKKKTQEANNRDTNKALGEKIIMHVNTYLALYNLDIKVGEGAVSKCQLKFYSISDKELVFNLLQYSQENNKHEDLLNIIYLPEKQEFSANFSYDHCLKFSWINQKELDKIIEYKALFEKSLEMLKGIKEVFLGVE